jgi:hypothetical protein
MFSSVRETLPLFSQIFGSQPLGESSSGVRLLNNLNLFLKSHTDLSKVFPETSQKPLEEVEEIFDDTTPGSLKFLGTPAWKTSIDKRSVRLERGEYDAEDKLGHIDHDESPERVAEAPKAE